MNYRKNQLQIISFYRFATISNKIAIKNKIDNFLKNKNVRGTILLSNEGINGSISGVSNEVDKVVKYVKSILGIRKLTMNASDIEFLPFNRMKVRLKKEIISLGINKNNFNYKKNKYVDPIKWKHILNDKNVKVVDVRNNYEISIGKFKFALDPKTNNFREFPKKFKKMGISKNDKVAMYCTGGIRCEKASAYLRSNGFNNIYQLKGGILSYLQKVKKDNLWHGECFVFDERVSVNKFLSKGQYLQCYGCRRAISDEDTKSKHYKKGIQCAHCYNTRSDEQKKRSKIRQTQIDIAIKDNLPTPFRKVIKI